MTPCNSACRCSLSAVSQSAQRLTASPLRRPSSHNLTACPHVQEPQERPSIAALLKYPFISRFTKADSDKSSIPSQLAEIPNATFEGREHGGTLDASNWSDILGIVDPQRKDLMLHTGSEASHTGGEPTEQAASTAPGSGPDAVEAEKPAEPSTEAE